MKKRILRFVLAGGVLWGICCRDIYAAGEVNAIRGKTYVAACPPVTEKIPRTPGPQRVMIIGAHPDDADIQCGCTAAKLIAKGDERHDWQGNNGMVDGDGRCERLRLAGR